MEHVTTEAGSPSPFAPGTPYGQNNSSVSVVQESDEIWSDAHETVDEDHVIQEDERLDGDELDEEDRIRSASAPGIDFDHHSHKFADSDGKDAPVITTSLEQTSSSMASPVGSDSHVATNANRDYNHPPPSQSSPELFANATASAPRSTQSLDVFQQYSSDRATSPTPTYNSAGVDRQNSRRRLYVVFRVARIVFLAFSRNSFTDALRGTSETRRHLQVAYGNKES